MPCRSRGPRSDSRLKRAARNHLVKVHNPEAPSEPRHAAQGWPCGAADGRRDLWRFGRQRTHGTFGAFLSGPGGVLRRPLGGLSLGHRAV